MSDYLSIADRKVWQIFRGRHKSSIYSLSNKGVCWWSIRKLFPWKPFRWYKTTDWSWAHVKSLLNRSKFPIVKKQTWNQIIDENFVKGSWSLEILDLTMIFQIESAKKLSVKSKNDFKIKRMTQFQYEIEEISISTNIYSKWTQ